MKDICQVVGHALTYQTKADHRQPEDTYSFRPQDLGGNENMADFLGDLVTKCLQTPSGIECLKNTALLKLDFAQTHFRKGQWLGKAQFERQ